MRKISGIILVLVIMLLITLLSSQIGEQSHQLSQTVINLVPIEKMITDSRDEMLNVSVRKIAHIFLYLVLGAVVHSTINEFIKLDVTSHSPLQNKEQFRLKMKSYQIRNSMISCLICLVFACSDEMHQYFIPGRAASIQDVGFDAIGFISGTAIASLLFCKRNWRRS